MANEDVDELIFSDKLKRENNFPHIFVLRQSTHGDNDSMNTRELTLVFRSNILEG